MFLRVPVSLLAVGGSVYATARAGHSTMREVFVESVAPSDEFRLGVSSDTGPRPLSSKAAEAGDHDDDDDDGTGAAESKEDDANECESKEEDDDAAHHQSDDNVSPVVGPGANELMHAALDRRYEFIMEDLSEWAGSDVAEAIDTFSIVQLSGDTLLPTGTVATVRPQASTPSEERSASGMPAHTEHDMAASGQRVGHTDDAGTESEASMQRRIFDEVVLQYGYLRVVSDGSFVYGVRLATCAEMMHTGIGVPDDAFIHSLPGAVGGIGTPGAADAAPGSDGKGGGANRPQLGVRLCPSIAIDTFVMATDDFISRSSAESADPRRHRENGMVNRVQFLRPAGTKLLAGWTYAAAVREDIVRVSAHARALMHLRRQVGTPGVDAAAEAAVLDAEARALVGDLDHDILLSSVDALVDAASSAGQLDGTHAADLGSLLDAVVSDVSSAEVAGSTKSQIATGESEHSYSSEISHEVEQLRRQNPLAPFLQNRGNSELKLLDRGTTVFDLVAVQPCGHGGIELILPARLCARPPLRAKPIMVGASGAKSIDAVISSWTAEQAGSKRRAPPSLALDKKDAELCDRHRSKQQVRLLQGPLDQLEAQNAIGGEDFKTARITSLVCDTLNSKESESVATVLRRVEEEAASAATLPYTDGLRRAPAQVEVDTSRDEHEKSVAGEAPMVAVGTPV